VGRYLKYAAAFLSCFHMTELNEDSDSQFESGTYIQKYRTAYMCVSTHP
jgi:hypothetical protein